MERLLRIMAWRRACGELEFIICTIKDNRRAIEFRDLLNEFIDKANTYIESPD